jgi:hypothetical protein
MYLTRMSWFSLLVLALALPVFAQKPIIEYGQINELRGITKIFVNTGVSFQKREKMVRVINKRLPNLEVVSRPEEADIHLRFSLKDDSSGCAEGAATVVKLLGGNRERVLLSISDVMPPMIYGDSMVNYAMEYARPFMIAREFVRAYRWANS